MATARVVSQTPSSRANRYRRRRLQGWRFGVTFAAVVAGVVFLINLTLTIAGAAMFHKNIAGGIGTAYEGDCNVVNEWATWVGFFFETSRDLVSCLRRW